VIIVLQPIVQPEPEPKRFLNAAEVRREYGWKSVPTEIPRNFGFGKTVKYDRRQIERYLTSKELYIGRRA